MLSSLSFALKPLDRIDCLISFLIGFGVIFYVYSDSVNRQWDFPVYYLAAKTVAQGSNPYDPAALQAASDSIEEVGYGGSLPFLYPPHLARVMYPLSMASFFSATFCWMLLKCVALEAIIFLSLKLIGQPIHLLGLILAHIAALFYRPISLDFSAGNIALFEAFLVLLGLNAWRCNRYTVSGFFTILGCSIKGTPILIALYPLHLREWRLVKALTIFVVIFGFYMLFEWQLFVNFIAFYQSPEWEVIWDEQVQSFYNCSSVTVILRTFSDTYFAEPIIRFPMLATILIPIFPLVIFGLMAFSIKKAQSNGYKHTSGILISMIICGVLLLPPRLAGYTLVWTLFPFLQVCYCCWDKKKVLPFIFVLAGLTLIQLNLPPNHVAAGITQLLIDKDFFGLLCIFTATVLLCVNSTHISRNSLKT
jgi:glycosyl transferase family 87